MNEKTSDNHECAWCPVEVRNLYAVAHNACGAVERSLDGHGDWSRARRKLAQLRRALDDAKRDLDRHFGETGR